MRQAPTASIPPGEIGSELAAELGLSKSALYHHVPSKTSLLAQALDEALDALELTIDEAAGDPSVPAYDRIVPCGIREAGVTSLSAELGRRVPVAEVLPVVERFLLRDLGQSS